MARANRGCEVEVGGMTRLAALDADAPCVMAVLIEIFGLREAAALLFTNWPFLITTSLAMGVRINGLADLAFPAGLIS